MKDDAMTARVVDMRGAAPAAPAAPAAAEIPDPQPITDTDYQDPGPILPGNDSLDGLARMAGVERLAGQATVSVRPADALEELLVHELVAGHAFAMNVLSQANNQLLAVDTRAGGFDDLARLNQATAATGLVGIRMMEAVQRGILLLDRLRHGIRYSHTITRVAAAPVGAGAPALAEAGEAAP